MRIIMMAWDDCCSLSLSPHLSPFPKDAEQQQQLCAAPSNSSRASASQYFGHTVRVLQSFQWIVTMSFNFEVHTYIRGSWAVCCRSHQLILVVRVCSTHCQNGIFASLHRSLVWNAFFSANFYDANHQYHLGNDDVYVSAGFLCVHLCIAQRLHLEQRSYERGDAF